MKKVAVSQNDKTIDYHNKTHISDILEDLIKIHTYIPGPKHIKHATATASTQTRFNKHEQI